MSHPLSSVCSDDVPRHNFTLRAENLPPTPALIIFASDVIHTLPDAPRASQIFVGDNVGDAACTLASVPSMTTIPAGDDVHDATHYLQHASTSTPNVYGSWSSRSRWSQNTVLSSCRRAPSGEMGIDAFLVVASVPETMWHSILGPTKMGICSLWLTTFLSTLISGKIATRMLNTACRPWYPNPWLFRGSFSSA